MTTAHALFSIVSPEFGDVRILDSGHYEGCVVASFSFKSLMTYDVGYNVKFYFLSIFEVYILNYLLWELPFFFLF